MKEYYLELKTKSQFITNHFFSNFNELRWIDYCGFLTARFSNDLISEEPALVALDKKFKIESIGVVMLLPNKSYLWHVDQKRGLSINMLLSYDHVSHSVFGDFGQRPSREQVDIKELEYKKDTFYVFNTQKPHTVFNFNGSRYLFTVEFVKPKTELVYNQVRDFALTSNL